eukprot:COSAG06_NODE_11398_length_1515_cov_2.315678_3_plen_187_part_01
MHRSVHPLTGAFAASQSMRRRGGLFTSLSPTSSPRPTLDLSLSHCPWPTRRLAPARHTTTPCTSLLRRSCGPVMSVTWAYRRRRPRDRFSLLLRMEINVKRPVRQLNHRRDLPLKLAKTPWLDLSPMPQESAQESLLQTSEANSSIAPDLNCRSESSGDLFDQSAFGVRGASSGGFSSSPASRVLSF